MTAPTPEEFERHLHEGPTLVEFILARVADWEAMAQAADTGAPWEAVALGVLGHPRNGYMVAEQVETEQADHIAAHDPARVLAQCAAYRRIVEDFDTLHEDYRTTHDRTTEARRLQAAISLGHLAAIWADRADYDERWRP